MSMNEWLSPNKMSGKGTVQYCSGTFADYERKDLIVGCPGSRLPDMLLIA